ncbi:hypothetical protein MMC30_000167 [Trapelia coarctata]|nr:hypothetical protein [Trapelia coarctata]
MIEHDPVIGEYEHEKFRPREVEALQTLRKVASLVKPIMRQRGWTVGILTEFWPTEKNLLGLNWNQGQKICLRLRYPYDEKQFIPLEEIVDTMLHELCHIVHGPHNEAFNNLWNQLRSEQEALMRKGYTGEGFLSTGHKLGGARIPMHEARRRAREAAEKRKTLTAGSGQRLGGAPVRRGADIRKVIADAATRRITVTKGCASNTERSRGLVEESTKNGFRTKAEEENANEEAIMQAYIEMIQEEEREKYGKDYVPPSKSNPGGSQGMAIHIESDSESEEEHQPPNTDPQASSSAPTFKGTKKPEEPQPSKSSSQATGSVHVSKSTKKLGEPDSPSVNPPENWSCEICTLSNPPTFLCCDACGTERPASTFIAAQSATPSISSRSLPSHTRTAAGNTPSNSSKSVKALSSLSAVESKKPLGWVCHRCGNFMENQWWTCAGCGTMKQSS